jgi:energy-coupling factor transporter ATP-binding protein EcfA2
VKILRATFLGIRGVTDGTYDFAHPVTGAPHSMILVTGPEASGKTRFLEAILATKEAIGPYGPMSTGATWLEPGSQIAKIMVSFALDEEERQYAGTSDSVVDGEATFLRERVRRDADEGLVALLARYEHGHHAGKVEYFPSSRKLSPLGPFHGTGVIEQRMQRVSKEPTKYGFIVRFLRELPQDPAAQKVFAQQMERLSPSCRYVPVEAQPGLPRCFSSRGGPESSIVELSETEQQAVLVAATAVLIGLSRSLVLIDRPELGTSPGRVGAFVEALSLLGQDNQIIMASSSNDFVAALPKSNVIRLEGA